MYGVLKRILLELIQQPKEPIFQARLLYCWFYSDTHNLNSSVSLMKREGLRKAEKRNPARKGRLLEEK